MSDKDEKTPPSSNDVPELAAELAEAQVPPMTQVENDPRLGHVITELRHVYDPEIPVNIYELGLIYNMAFKEDEENTLKVIMTLTSPNCPVAEELPVWVKEAAEKADGVESADVELSWDPPWTPSMMAESARYQLNMF